MSRSPAIIAIDSAAKAYKVVIDAQGGMPEHNGLHRNASQPTGFLSQSKGIKKMIQAAPTPRGKGDSRPKFKNVDDVKPGAESRGDEDGQTPVRSDAHHRALVDSDFDARVILRAARDGAGRIRDFFFIEANNAACAYNMLSREQLVGHRLLDLFPNAEAAGLFEMYVRTIETGEPLELPEFSYLHDRLGENHRLAIRAIPIGDELAYTWREINDQPRPLALERRKQRAVPGETEAQLRELQALTRSLIETREQEHQVISRELHDNIAQVLSAATARIALTQDEPIPVWLRQELLDLREHLKAALADVRTLARELRPSVFDHQGFAAALDKHAEAFRERTRISLEVTVVPEAVSFLGNGDLTHLFRLTQEALQNIEEHSRAANAWIDLWEHDGAMQLEIGDDGCAFTAERVAEAQRDGHLGLLGMRERAELLGGTFLLEAVPGQGTVIRIAIPPPPAKPASQTHLNNHHEANLSPHC